MKRNLGRGRPPKDAGEAGYLKRQAEDLQNIYNPDAPYHTDECSSLELAKRVARHALLGEYKPIDLNAIMNGYA